MRKLLRILILVLTGLALLAAVATGVFVRALHHVPEFYQAAIEGDAAKQKAQGRELEIRAVELASHAQVAGRWQQNFTAEQINGWLAVGRFESANGVSPEMRNLIPPDLIDPRVAIEPDGITLACRFDTGIAGETVLSLKVEAFLTEENEVALRMRKARAGAIPAPLDVVLKQISDALSRANCPARTSQIDGDPVVLISLPSVGKRGELTLHLDTLRLSEGKIEVAGTTKRR